MRDWWLDERAYAGEEHLDDQFVAGYDRKQQYDPTYDVEMLISLGLGPAAAVIDFGAGTGRFAIAAAATGATVYAVDVSPAMLEVLRTRGGAYANLHVIEAGLLSYRHRGGPIQFVYSRNTLHQIPDFWKAMALHRIASMLAPGGILLLRDIAYDDTPDHVAATIDAWLEAAASDPSTGYTRADLSRHVSKEFSTFSWVLEDILERTGFDIVDKRTRNAIFAAYTCRRRA